MSFLFTWQTSIQAPLVVASAAIGFSGYLQYLVDLKGLGTYLFGSFTWIINGHILLTDLTIGPKMVSGAVVLLMIFLLYRNIQSIGKLSVILWIITGGTMLWLIISGLPHFNFDQAFHAGNNHFSWNLLVSAAFGQASQKAIYSYLGYYNVCHLGAEIRDPQRNIPRAIFISIIGIAILYLLMQSVVLSTLSWEEIKGSDFVVSLYFERLYNHTVAQVATVLILCIALASLFSVLLGYSRVPYAAAKDGLFFKPFAKLHPKHHIPHISLLAIGGLGFIFSLLLRLGDVISAIIVMRILVQFVSQAVGVIAWRIRLPNDERPFKMPLFPLPALISIFIWLMVFCSNKWVFIKIALAIIISGILLFQLIPKSKNDTALAIDPKD